jgi:hypothetical protein
LEICAGSRILFLMTALWLPFSQVYCRSLFCFQPSLYAEHVCCPPHEN